MPENKNPIVLTDPGGYDAPAGTHHTENSTVKRLSFFSASCLLALLLSPSLAVSAFGQTNSTGLVIKDFGSLDGAVNEKKFKPALAAWVRHCNKLMERFKTLPQEKVDKLFIEGKALDALRQDGPLFALEEIVEPVLARWAEVPRGEEDKQLSAADRKVIALLRQYGIMPGTVEGSPFLAADEAFFTTLFVPFLSPAASGYMAVRNSQPQNFFYTHGCYYTNEEMGGWAVAWEKYLNSRPAGVYAQDAAKRYQVIMKYLLFGEAKLEIQPAFTDGKMVEHWIAGLQAVAAGHPQSRTAALVSDYLAVIKADGYKLPAAVKKTFAAKIAAVGKALR